MLNISRFSVENLTEGCVTDRVPRFSFALESDRKGAALQKAVLRVNGWSCETDAQLGIPYEGPELEPFTRYTAAVEAVYDAGESAAADDTYLFDYALLFPVILEEYLQSTGDREALDDLYDIAAEQLDAALGQCREDGTLSPQAIKDSFIDWGEELDKSGCALAVLIYALEYGKKLAERKHDAEKASHYRKKRVSLSAAAMEHFWKEDEGCFISNGQASAALQAWMVLAGVPTAAQAQACMRKALTFHGEPKMTTPCMHHYFVTALLKAGLIRQSKAHLRSYWGSMLEAGTDTFWECWDPDQPGSSPYGDPMMNSRCHAWSCTPVYIIQKYLLSSKK